MNRTAFSMSSVPRKTYFWEAIKLAILTEEYEPSHPFMSSFERELSDDTWKNPEKNYLSGSTLSVSMYSVVQVKGWQAKWFKKTHDNVRIDWESKK